MTDLQTSSPISTVPPPAPLLAKPAAQIPQPRLAAEPLTLEQQGVRADWFTRGIEESNCALFHASLQPILPKLKDRIQSWLKSSCPDPSMASDQFVIADLMLGVIDLAFKESLQWRQDQPVLDWLASFVPVIYAESDPT